MNGVNPISIVSQALQQSGFETEKFSNSVWDEIKQVTDKEAKAQGGAIKNIKLFFENTRESLMDILRRANLQPKRPVLDVEKNAEGARAFLVSNLKSLSDEELAQIGITRERLNVMIEYLEKELRYDDDSRGAMKAEPDGIVVSKSSCANLSPTDFVKVLIHEANHGYHHKNREVPNGDAEELECERIALLTTAVLMKKSSQLDPNYAVYPLDSSKKTPVRDYLGNEELLKQDLDYWLELRDAHMKKFGE